MTAISDTRPSFWLLPSIAAGALLPALDLFIVNLAFRAIQKGLPGSTVSDMGWVLTIYAILFAALLVPSGRLGDSLGRVQIFRTGMVLFGVASVACALAPTLPFLIAARAVQGIGAALMIPASLGLLLTTYHVREHTRMIGIWAATGSVGAALGPVLGGFLVEFDWRLIFLINVPLVVLALIGSRSVPKEETKARALPDLVGSAFLAAATGAIVAAISYGPNWGWTSRPLLATVAAAIILGALFIWRGRTAMSPALDLRLFRNTQFSLANIGIAIFYVGFAMIILGGPLYLTEVRNWNTFDAGLGFMSGPAVAGLTAFFAGRLKLGPHAIAIMGSAASLVGGIWWLVTLSDTSVYAASFLPGLLFTGFAAGAAQTGFIAFGAKALPSEHYGAGTGTLNTARQIGGAIGIAILIALLTAGHHAAAFHIAWIAIILCSLISGVVGLIALRVLPASAVPNVAVPGKVGVET